MNDLFDKSRPRRNLDGGRIIAIRGAREHNLKNVDVEIPRDQLVVFTGLSGSGKSSLAFDTIYAEGQRRYVESLSAYARQFLEMMQKPDVDQIDGLSPAISIEQKTTSKNPRSTVGTVTEIYDYMRLLWARVGVPYSPATGLPIESQTVSADGRPRAGAAGRHAALSAGAGRARPQGRVPQGDRRVPEEAASSASRSTASSTRSPTSPALDKKFKHDIDVVVDRIVVRADIGDAARGLARDGAEARRRPGGRGDRRRRRGRRRKANKQRNETAERADLLGEIRLPGVRLHHSGDRAAAVLVQQPVRRLPEMRRARRRAADRCRAGHPRHATRRCSKGAIAPWAKSSLALLHADARGARQALQVHARHQVEGAAEERRRRRSCYGSGEDEIKLRL